MVTRSSKSATGLSFPTVSRNNTRSVFSPHSGMSKLSARISMMISLVTCATSSVRLVSFIPSICAIAPSCRAAVLSLIKPSNSPPARSEARSSSFARPRASYFIPLGKTLLEFGARAGLVRPLKESTSDITAIPIDERFFNGGSTTVRSFGERDLGPHDHRGHPLGGEFYTIFNVEYTFPLYGELQGAVFVDAGNLLPEADNPGLGDMRYGIGAGLRYKLPIGPIRLDYGVNPNPREHEDFGAFHFSFGFAF